MLGGEERNFSVGMLPRSHGPRGNVRDSDHCHPEWFAPTRERRNENRNTRLRPYRSLCCCPKTVVYFFGFTHKKTEGIALGSVSMQSKVAQILDLQYHPVAILWTDEKPSGALQFRHGKWGCVMALFAQAAARGRTAVLDRDTFGCYGGGIGLGFGNQYETWQGGIDCFYGFLSTGNEGRANAERIADGYRRSGRKLAAERFLRGEGIVKTPQLAKKYVESLPIDDIPARYVVFKPLMDVQEGETPVIVIFIANPDQISALVTLANYGRGATDNVVVRSGAGCQTIGIHAYAEARSNLPRAVVGMTDTAARVYSAALLGHNYLTFAVPFKMFSELESNVEGSFLQKETWARLVHPIRAA